jgi:transcriptional regulator with GAF, ATPase, and Fis domain
MVDEFERQLILETLEKCNWSQTEAAKRMNVALSTLNQKIQRLNIDVKKRKGRGPASEGEVGGRL